MDQQEISRRKLSKSVVWGTPALVSTFATPQAVASSPTIAITSFGVVVTPGTTTDSALMSVYFDQTLTLTTGKTAPYRIERPNGGGQWTFTNNTVSEIVYAPTITHNGKVATGCYYIHGNVTKPSTQYDALKGLSYYSKLTVTNQAAPWTYSWSPISTTGCPK